MDRYGLRPLYRSGDTVSPVLLDLPLSEPDWDALSVFIRLGYFVGNATAFRHIRHAGPEPWITKASTMSRDAAIDGYGELFRAAVRRLIPEGEAVLPLSGGRDSRHILFELLEAGVRPETATLRAWLPEPSEDLRVARMLAAHFGLSHTALGRVWPSVRAEREKNRLTGFCADEHAWTLPLRRFLDGRPSFDGIGGDVLSAGLYHNPNVVAALLSGDTAAAAEMLLGREAIWAACLAPWLYGGLSRERASAVLQRELAKHLDAPNPMSSFLFWNRTRREIALFGFDLLGDPLMPYLDDAVYDHLTSLPVDYVLDGAFHDETIRRMFPQHAGLPFAGKAAGGRWRKGLFYASVLAAEAHRLAALSSWVKRRFLYRGVKPEDVARVIWLLQVERLVTD